MEHKYTARLDFSSAFGSLESCPACASTDLKVVVLSELTQFRCDSCGSGWRFELGRVTRVQGDTG